MPREREMRALVSRDPLIIALRRPAWIAAGVSLAIGAVGLVHLACRAAAALAGLL